MAEAHETASLDSPGDVRPGAPATANTPDLTWSQYLAFAAFALFVIAAICSNQTSAVTSEELAELRKLTLFLIGALLPSDALIRFGRNLLFQTVDDATQGAKDVPATTRAQKLAFAVFVVVLVLTFISSKVVSAGEFDAVNDVARVLIIALLPSDAGIRFGRALYYRSPTTPVPTSAALKHV